MKWPDGSPGGSFRFYETPSEGRSVTSWVTPGTGVKTALGVNVGSAGAVVVNGGALGTPSSGTLTNATGLPIGGIAGLGTGAGTAMGNNVNGANGLLVYNNTPGVQTIDAHAGSTTITLVPGICPIIHNGAQADADVNNTLPAIAEGACFIAQVRTTRTKYWRLTAATGGTVCLDGTCSKNYISFDSGNLSVDNYYSCVAGATDTTAHWSCYSGRGTAVTN